MKLKERVKNGEISPVDALAELDEYDRKDTRIARWLRSRPFPREATEKNRTGDVSS